MNKPVISWLVQDDDVFAPYNKYTADGALSSGDTLTKKIQIWNNYCGNLAINDAYNARLVLAFKNYEDNFLLNLLKLRVVNGENVYRTPIIDIDRAIFDIGTLYGNASGTYAEVELVIGPIPKNLKSELKSLIMYVDYDETGSNEVDETLYADEREPNPQTNVNIKVNGLEIADDSEIQNDINDILKD